MIGILDLKTSYSFMQSSIKIEEAVVKAKKLGYSFISITDNFLHGTYHFLNSANKHQIKPIFGLNIKIKIADEKLTFLLYAKDEEGFKSLLEISKLISYDDITINDLLKFQSSLVIILKLTKVNDELVNNTFEIIKKLVKKTNDFYLGLHLDNNNPHIFETYYKFAKNNNIKSIPLHPVRYLSQDDEVLYHAIKKIDNENYQNISNNYYLLPVSEFRMIYQNYYNIDNVFNQFINLINFKLKTPNYEMPLFENLEDPNRYLKSLAHIGLEKRLKQDKITDTKKYQKRLQDELEVIFEMGFANYFLIVFDLVRYAKKSNILVGPGRGSAAGSLVSYSIGITNIDPVKYNLFFERFLNIHRQSMPDIDLDFEDIKRDEVILYAKEKYGLEHVSYISTFGTFQIKSAIRDLAKIYKLSDSRMKGILANTINNQIDKTDEEAYLIYSLIKKLEGIPKYLSTHPAGIVFAKQKLINKIPLIKGPNTLYQAQLDQHELESFNILKIDFLGLKNLTIIQNIVNKIQIKNPNFNLNDINLLDDKVYKMLSSGQTNGIFQLESIGMRKVIQKLKPENFNDLQALLALYRPGPIKMIDTYIKRKEGEKFNYLDSSLENILKETYGIIIYQEQIIEIVKEFANYTLAEADLFRRAISKKDRDILEKEKTTFINKAISNGKDIKLAKDIYNLIYQFSDYGFNKSHSVSYALIAYQMAYLKTHFYSYFISELLNNTTGNQSETKNLIKEAQNNKIEIITPNILISSDEYLVKENKILMPLNSIKGITIKKVLEIIKIRNENHFETFTLTKSLLKDILSEYQFQNLIKVGAFNSFKYNVKTLLENSSFETSGFEKYVIDYKITIKEEYPFNILKKYEQEALGFNINFVADSQIMKLINFHNLKNFSFDQTKIKTVFIIEEINVITDKNNNEMAFLKLSDGKNKIESILFSTQYKMYQDILKINNIYIFTMTKSIKNKTEYIINKVENS